MQIKACRSPEELQALIGQLQIYYGLSSDLDTLIRELQDQARREEKKLGAATGAAEQAVQQQMSSTPKDVMFWKIAGEEVKKVLEEEGKLLNAAYERGGMDEVKQHLEEERKKPNSITSGPLSEWKTNGERADKVHEMIPQEMRKMHQKETERINALNVSEQEKMQLHQEAANKLAQENARSIATKMGVNDPLDVAVIARDIQQSSMQHALGLGKEQKIGQKVDVQRTTDGKGAQIQDDTNKEQEKGAQMRDDVGKAKMEAAVKELNASGLMGRLAKIKTQG